MPEPWFDQAPASTAPSRAESSASPRKEPTPKQEAKHMVRYLKNKRGPADELVIAVVRKGTEDAMERRLPSLKPWTEFFNKKSDVTVTTAALLQHEIHKAVQQGHIRALTIVASGEVEHLAFHVLSRIARLRLHRCGFGANAQDDLLVNGASTFRRVRLDEWEGVDDRKRRGEIWVHPGVAIAADPARPAWARIRAAFAGSDADKESLRRGLSFMEGTRMDGEGWWKKWRGPLAGIFGVLAGGAGFAGAVTAAAGGAYVNFAWGSLSLKAGAAVGTVTGAACGGAVLLGAGTAAAVYFIPWESVFGVLKSALSWLWAKVVSLWDRFTSWWSAYWSRGGQSGRRGGVPGPMMA